MPYPLQRTRSAGRFSCFFRYGISYGSGQVGKANCRKRKSQKPVNRPAMRVCGLLQFTARLRQLIRQHRAKIALPTLFSCRISCQKEQNIYLLHPIQKAGPFFGMVMRIFSNSPISNPSIYPYCLKSCIMACDAGLQDFL